MDTVFRIAAIYLFILVGLRVLGKREFGQLSPLELVTLLMIPEVVSQALTGDDYSLTNAFVGVATLLVLVFATSLVMHRFKKVEIAISSEPSVLVHRGRMFERVMNVERVSADEIFTEMHKSGLQTLDEVEWAILEADGNISIVPSQLMRNQRSTVPRAGKEQKLV